MLLLRTWTPGVAQFDVANARGLHGQVDMLFYNMSTVLKFVVLLRFRYSRPDEDRPFKIPLGNIVRSQIHGSYSW